ncbi:MAG: mucin desulfatase, partial [Lachnospiraceae bacterium]|nr:mucin desulfatase [Lachnospiraceae bacterium]
MKIENPACAKIEEAIAAFDLEGKLVDVKPYGNGHINDTFLITSQTGQGSRRFILQRMNHSIFKNPQQLMENVVNVTEYLREVISRQGGDPDRETLNVVKTRDGANYYEDSSHNFWRVFLYIERTLCLEQVESAKDFYDSAVAFGNFQRMLADYPARDLHETILNFHNTPSRFRYFQKAVQADKMGRAENAMQE